MRKFFVNLPLAIFTILFFTLCLALTFYITITNVTDTQIHLVTVVLTVMTILTLAIDLFMGFVMCARISINENGVEKYLFGKKIKEFTWESICDIKGINNGAYWIVFCNRPVSDEELAFCNRKKFTIPICKSKEVIDSIYKYCPKLKVVA
ncbi:MAG: hypothetical protein NC033_05025 [Clostridiales bacterium]|nr:hypothetical protein [Clostridiales bacterium]